MCISTNELERAKQKIFKTKDNDMLEELKKFVVTETSWPRNPDKDGTTRAVATFDTESEAEDYVKAKRKEDEKYIYSIPSNFHIYTREEYEKVKDDL